MSPRIVSDDHHPTLRHPDREAIGVKSCRPSSSSSSTSHSRASRPTGTSSDLTFGALHQQLDELVDCWRDAADSVAERAVALGHPPDGRVATVAARTELDALPEGPLPDADVIAAFTRLLTDAIGAIRERMDLLEDVDAVTADLLHGIAGQLEQNLWMIRVQVA